MLKKCFNVLVLTLSLLFTSLAYAEHDPDDKYEAMCQSTGCFSDIKYPIKDLAKNREARVVQLFGHCGEQPNILLIDYVSSMSKSKSNRIKHDLQVWESPEKDHPYWKFVYSRSYITDKQNNIIKTYLNQCNKESFINVEIKDIMHLTVKRYCSAKVGSPIFPHAQGDLVCQNGVDEPNLLEQGYNDYLKDLKKQ